MNIPAIKKLVENYELEQLEQAEEKLAEEQDPDIPVEGVDAGEKLTHAIAAVWVKKKMAEDDLPAGKAIRAYTQKVRKSIS